MNSGSSYYTACNKGHFNMFSSIDQPMGSEENNDMISHTSFMQSNNSLCLLVSEGRFFFQISETVSECFLAPTQQFSAISLPIKKNLL
jgi:hypothetical protein